MCSHGIASQFGKNIRRYTESESGFGVLEGALASSLDGKLMIEKEILYSQLVDIKKKMVPLKILSSYNNTVFSPLFTVISG